MIDSKTSLMVNIVFKAKIIDIYNEVTRNLEIIVNEQWLESQISWRLAQMHLIRRMDNIITDSDNLDDVEKVAQVIVNEIITARIETIHYPIR